MAVEPRLYVFYGPDGFSAGEELTALRARLDSDGNLAHNTSRFDARRDPVDIAELLAACQTASFFAEPRLIIAEGLLERLGGGRRTGTRSRRGAAPPRASDTDRLVDGLATLPATTTVVFLDQAVPKSLFDALAGIATLREFKVLRADAIRPWALRRAESAGATLTPEAGARLADLIDGFHLGDLAHEIDKLVAYTAGRPIEVEDIEAVVSAALQHQTWDLTDALVSGRADRALGVLQRIDEEHPAQMLFSMVVRQYRQVMLVQAAKGEGLSDPEIGRRLGINHPFPLSKLIDQARRYQPAQLEGVYRRLLEIDVAVKTGVTEIETALEMLIVEIATILGSARRPQAVRSR